MSPTRDSKTIVSGLGVNSSVRVKKSRDSARAATANAPVLQAHSFLRLSSCPSHFRASSAGTAGMWMETRDGLTRMMVQWDQHGFAGGNGLVLQAILGREPASLLDYFRELAASQPPGASVSL